MNTLGGTDQEASFQILFYLLLKGMTYEPFSSLGLMICCQESRPEFLFMPTPHGLQFRILLSFTNEVLALWVCTIMLQA